MITRKYKIADKVVEVTSIHAEVHKYCADYQTDENVDYSVTTTQADIDFERDIRIWRRRFLEDEDFGPRLKAVPFDNPVFQDCIVYWSEPARRRIPILAQLLS